ncbi:MAG: LPS export ABC transporter periplasmic protein LptC [Bacteroidetes bacterium]|jgi:LPS export ABC transporter protein LptC|nr:MAG: LPS export ABC transporter periplasmic protein LptC [Bacteroidota bacterium]PTM19750.1 MAG: LPS export ABC transporter periplasmic protein LptC [Bacteroidota bacterium]
MMSIQKRNPHSALPHSTQPFFALPHTTPLHHLLLPLFLFILALPACTDLSEFDRTQVQSAMLDSLVTTTESMNVDMTLFRDQQAQLRIRATKATTYQSSMRKEIEFKGPVSISLFDADSTSATATSGRAVYHEQKGEFELFDDVQIQAEKERHLQSDYLKWIEKEDRILSPEFVIIITPTDSISGYGFSGTIDLSEYTITQPRGRVLID